MTENDMEKRISRPAKGRLCFRHLGGKLGELLFRRMVELEWIALEEDKTSVYVVTELGRKEFGKLGITLE